MAIQLQKGGYFDIVTDGNSSGRMVVGLGWDPVKNWRTALMEKFLGTVVSDIDCDASVLMLDRDGKLQSNSDVIHFGNLQSRDGSITHTGDNLSGDGSGDDEQIVVEVNRIPDHIRKLVFVVNIYDSKNRKHHFGMIQNAYLRVTKENETEELLRYHLTEDYTGKTSLVVGEMSRQQLGWRFTAIGEGTDAVSLNDIAATYIK
ncbi:TerD family protein [Mesobacillus zeae]|uniref:TerD family protein n=1 Tax=Mesobacillus zeae TaxID=1917180 RepID=A0A398B8B4_9BACI|nr:TerD family protein [Mesobacillus zeae]RID84150.1 TerD family protein [Mesobacillus zeae]